MPYLAWQEGPLFRRHRLEGVVVLGSDRARCGLINPDGGAPVQAVLQSEGASWVARPLEGAVVRRDAEMLPIGGATLTEGDTLSMGRWELRFSTRFPGLDGERFQETSGQLPLPSGSAAAAPLRWLAGLAQRLEQGLLSQEDPSAMASRLLEEARSFLGADAGVHLTRLEGDAFWVGHRVGEMAVDGEPVRSLILHALRDGVSLLSNEPGRDPRAAAAANPVGPLLVAPLPLEAEAPESAFVLARRPGAPGFHLSDLSLLRAASDLAALAHRLSLVQRRLLTQAEMESVQAHLKREMERQDQRQGSLLSALGASLSRAHALARRIPTADGEALEQQLSRMRHQIEVGQTTDSGLRAMEGRSRSLTDLQARLVDSWAVLATSLELNLDLESAPPNEVWLGGDLFIDALHGMVDALFLQLPARSSIQLRWREEPGGWSLNLILPPGSARVSPDSWSRSVIASAGVGWRWSETGLSLLFRDAESTDPGVITQRMLGLVTEDQALIGLFQGAADADGLALFPLDENPPAPPLPVFEIAVIDARGVHAPVECLRDYRAHPSFATVPILVVRAEEADGLDFTAAGATDWLAGPLRWEALHHRLQALRRHRDLQRKARSSERLETMRQMAGTLKHEINNPLTVISLQVELLQRKFPEEVKLGKIADQVQRIQGLMSVLQKMREAGDEEYPGGTNILKV